MEGMPADDQYDVVAVLGAGLTKKGQLTVAGQMRAKAGWELVKNGWAKQVVFSGGKTRGVVAISEAEAMRDWISLDVQMNYEGMKSLSDKIEILLEDSSKDTVDNLQYLGRMAKEWGWRRVLVLTTAVDGHVHSVRQLSRQVEHDMQLEIKSAEELLEGLWEESSWLGSWRSRFGWRRQQMEQLLVRQIRRYQTGRWIWNKVAGWWRG